MINRNSPILRTIVLSILVMVTFMQCATEEITINEVEFFIAKEWKLQSLIGNGVEQTDEIIQVDNPTHSIKHYRLKLNKDYSFEHTGIDGSESSGSWQLMAGLSQLRLAYSDSTKQNYLLLDVQIRRLEMRVLKDPDKLGELDIRYILEPVKAQ